MISMSAFLIVTTFAHAGPSKEQVFEYEVAAPVVATAWANAIKTRFSGRDKDKFAEKYEGTHPLSAVEDSLSFSGRTLVAILEFPVNGVLEVRATGLGTASATLRFQPTNTVGEQSAWKKLGNKFAAEVEQAIAGASGATTADAIRQQVLGNLKTAPPCYNEVKVVESSPFAPVDWVAEALPTSASACGPRLAEALARYPEHQDLAFSWLQNAYSSAAGPEREGLLAVLRNVPNPSDEIRTLIAEAEAARVAEEAAAQAEIAATAEQLRAKLLASDGVKSGRWTVSTAVSDMDDSVSVDLSLPADTSISAWPGGSKRPVLHVRCQEGRQELFVWTGYSPAVETHNYGHDNATVTIRVDKGQAGTVLGGLSNSREATFLPKPESFARQLSSAETLVYRFTPLNSEPVTTSFTLGGLAEPLALVEAACP